MEGEEEAPGSDHMTDSDHMTGSDHMTSSDHMTGSDQVTAAQVDEIFASSGPATHSAPPGDSTSTSQTTLKKETQPEQHSIGGAIKGFFRKVFSGESLIPFRVIIYEATLRAIPFEK